MVPRARRSLLAVPAPSSATRRSEPSPVALEVTAERLAVLGGVETLVENLTKTVFAFARPRIAADAGRPCVCTAGRAVLIVAASFVSGPLQLDLAFVVRVSATLMRQRITLRLPLEPRLLDRKIS
jgi:hypothetical protein